MHRRGHIANGTDEPLRLGYSPDAPRRSRDRFGRAYRVQGRENMGAAGSAGRTSSTEAISWGGRSGFPPTFLTAAHNSNVVARWEFRFQVIHRFRWSIRLFLLATWTPEVGIQLGNEGSVIHVTLEIELRSDRRRIWAGRRRYGRDGRRRCAGVSRSQRLGALAAVVYGKRRHFGWWGRFRRRLDAALAPGRGPASPPRRSSAADWVCNLGAIG